MMCEPVISRHAQSLKLLKYMALGMFIHDSYLASEGGYSSMPHFRWLRVHRNPAKGKRGFHCLCYLLLKIPIGRISAKRLPVAAVWLSQGSTTPTKHIVD